MASSGYYYNRQHTPYYYNYWQPRTGSNHFSVHLCLFLATLSLVAATSLHARCEAALETLFDRLRLFLVLSPLVLLFVAQYWVTTGGGGGWRGGPFLVAPLMGDQLPRGSCQRAAEGASSPWAVAVALVLVLFLVSYQSSLQDWWFPLLSR